MSGLASVVSWEALYADLKIKHNIEDADLQAPIPSRASTLNRVQSVFFHCFTKFYFHCSLDCQGWLTPQFSLTPVALSAVVRALSDSPPADQAYPNPGAGALEAGCCHCLPLLLLTMSLWPSNLRFDHGEDEFFNKFFARRQRKPEKG